MNAQPKKDIVQEKPPLAQAVETAHQDGPEKVRVMSDQDSMLSDLVKEQKTLDEVEAIAVKSRTHINFLELPEECQSMHGTKYRFRWLAKSSHLEARLRTGIWTLCTRSNSPFIKAQRFKAHGAIEQAGMVLAFAPERIARIRELEPSKKSADLVKYYTETLPKQVERGFYRPETADAGDDEGGSGNFVEM